MATKTKTPTRTAGIFLVNDLVNFTGTCDNFTGKGKVAQLRNGVPYTIQRLDGQGWKGSAGSYRGFNPEENTPNGERYWTLEGVRADDFQLLKGTVTLKLPSFFQFGIKYDLESDPIELFYTRKEAEARIKKLVETSRSLKKDSVYIFEVIKAHKVTINTTLSTTALK